MTTGKPGLRNALREATSRAHDLLDRDLGGLDITQPALYACFLRIQHDARAPVEAWLSTQALDVPLPPAQSPLIEQDLAALGRLDGEKHSVTFEPPANADPIGAIWALAGSSLGNRMMLHRIAKAGMADRLPTAFLSDPAISDYWASLRPTLDRSVDKKTLANAVDAANAVFAMFWMVAQQNLRLQAA